MTALKGHVCKYAEVYLKKGHIHYDNHMICLHHQKHLLLTYSPSCPVAHSETTKLLHCCWSSAIFLISFHFLPMAPILASTVWCHEFFGLPLFLFSSTVQYRVVFMMDSFSCLMTWPIHLHWLLIIIGPMLSILHCCRSLLEKMCGHKICSILPKFLVWNEDYAKHLHYNTQKALHKCIPQHSCTHESDQSQIHSECRVTFYNNIQQTPMKIALITKEILGLY